MSSKHTNIGSLVDVSLTIGTGKQENEYKTCHIRSAIRAEGAPILLQCSILGIQVEVRADPSRSK